MTKRFCVMTPPKRVKVGWLSEAYYGVMAKGRVLEFIGADDAE